MCYSILTAMCAYGLFKIAEVYMATIEKLTGSKVKLGFEVSAEEFEKALQMAYVKFGKRYSVPGFRKGHAPRKMIENMYGQMAFFDDAFDIIYPDLYEAAIKEHGIEPVGRPDASIDDIGEDMAIKFSLEVPVKPEVALGEYMGIEVEKQEYNVTDEMLDEAMQRERENVARFVDVERPVENGDTVDIDYSGSVDGVKFDGGTAQGQHLVIGSGSFIPGFEEQLIGMNIGEEKDIGVKFPEEYHSEELKGKDAVFAIKLNGIQIKELPELDDEFAKDVSEFDTIAELRDHKRSELAENAEKQAQRAKENAVIAGAVKNATVEVPDAMVQSQIDRMLQDISYRLSMQGMSLDDYLMFTGSTQEAMRADMSGEALERVKTQLVLEAICKAEGLRAEDAEVDEKIAEYAAQYGQDVEKFKENITAGDREYFADQIVWEKTIAKVTDAAKEVKAKKPAAKKTAKNTEDGAEKPEKPAAKKKTAKTEEPAE